MYASDKKEFIEINFGFMMLSVKFVNNHELNQMEI